MKKTLALLLIIVIAYSCSRKEEPLPRPVNCDGLITDTTGTGDNGRIYMPNAFSPNADGLNDNVKPITQNITSYTFTVYDDFNRVMFTTTTPGLAWQPTSPDTTVAVRYYYRIQAITASGRNIGTCGDLYLLTCFPSGTPRSNFRFEDQLTPFGFTGVTAETMASCP